MNNLSDVWLVRRHIKIPGLRNSNDEFIIKQELSKLTGVKSIIININNRQVTLRYDASQLNFKTICIALKKIGMPVSNNWWGRIKGSWYEYTDSNARENANAPPAACCNKPPRSVH